MKCDHEVEHKEVLGYVLCVCCNHCQKENEKLNKIMKQILEESKDRCLCERDPLTMERNTYCGLCQASEVVYTQTPSR